MFILEQYSSMKEKLRLDKYLWAIRIFKTRSQAAFACEQGKVKQNGASVKASKNIVVGEKFEIKTEHKKWVVEVSALLYERKQFSEAINFYIDLTPEEEKQRIEISQFAFQTGKRQSKVGRPTKKTRRDLGDYLDF
jgi:ribosome-associated heat shock protein Hsp15